MTDPTNTNTNKELENKNETRKRKIQDLILVEDFHKNKKRKLNKKGSSNKDYADKLNEIYLSMFSSLEDTEEYEHFLNLYRNEEFDWIHLNKKPKSVNQIKTFQQLLNHTFYL